MPSLKKFFRKIAFVQAFNIAPRSLKRLCIVTFAVHMQAPTQTPEQSATVSKPKYYSDLLQATDKM